MNRDTGRGGKSGSEPLIKSDQPKGKRPSNGHRKQNPTGNGTEKGSGKVGNTEGKRPEESPRESLRVSTKEASV
ncbi:hypothetical protein ACGF5U_05800, partial [Streptomyces sp. NPDC047886]